jgi:hypothetical protein
MMVLKSEKGIGWGQGEEDGRGREEEEREELRWGWNLGHECGRLSLYGAFPDGSRDVPYRAAKRNEQVWSSWELDFLEASIFSSNSRYWKTIIPTGVNHLELLIALRRGLRACPSGCYGNSKWGVSRSWQSGCKELPVNNRNNLHQSSAFLDLQYKHHIEVLYFCLIVWSESSSRRNFVLAPCQASSRSCSSRFRRRMEAQNFHEAFEFVMENPAAKERWQHT